MTLAQMADMAEKLAEDLGANHIVGVTRWTTGGFDIAIHGVPATFELPDAWTEDRIDRTSSKYDAHYYCRHIGDVRVTLSLIVPLPDCDCQRGRR